MWRLGLFYVAVGHPGTWEGQVIMNEQGAPLPDLSGRWACRQGAFELRSYQPAEWPARAPNSSYAKLRGGAVEELCLLRAVYSYETRERLSTTIRCGGPSDAVWAEGLVANASHVAWPSGAWRRSGLDTLGRYSTPQIRKVHVVFMNHYDVGYTDFVNGVDNVYMHEYFPLAASTASQMRAGGQNFTYTTHPWLMDRYLACPCSNDPLGSNCLARSLDNPLEPPLRCPSTAELQNFTAAARKGEIAWNAVPFNIQPENMSPELFDAALELASRMDQRFGQRTRSASIRDVIYVTRATLPHLRRRNLTGLTIGSNGADFPPQVPKLHRWLDPVSGADIVVAYHPYCYGGYGLKDCAESPNGVALCTEFRTDNTGPPKDAAEVLGILAKVRGEYPGALVLPSTFDAFFEEVQQVKDQLPLVDLEVGDTWVYGNPSDPLKMAQYRGLQRAWIRCMAHEPRCALSDAAIQNMTFFLFKAPEHTWGTPGVSGWGQGGDYNTTKFRQDINNTNFMKAAQSWAEQRFFNELAVLALEESNHPLAAEARQALTTVERVNVPQLPGRPLALTTLVTLATGPRLRFGEDGSIVQLIFGDEDVAAGGAIGSFSYQTFNDTEWRPFTYAYMNDHQMQTGFSKPGSNNFSESRIFRPSLVGLYGNDKRLVAEMEVPRKAWESYGAPEKIYLEITSDNASSINLVWTTVGKQPTMIGESSSISFVPGKVQKTSSSGSAFRMMKLGAEVDPEGVLDGGNQYTHGVWGGVKMGLPGGQLLVDSLDAMNVNPITADFPVGNPLPASYQADAAKAGRGLSRLAAGSVKGFAANLHNNLWNTNYPLFYPYYDKRFCETPLNCANRNSLFRFRLDFEPLKTVYV